MWFAGRLSEREISFSALSMSDETDDGRFDADFYSMHIIYMHTSLLIHNAGQ